MLKRKEYWWSDPNLGKYIHRRMKEENITRNDLDEDTIDFFYQHIFYFDTTHSFRMVRTISKKHMGKR